MKKIFFIISLFAITTTIFAQITDTAQLNNYLRDTIRDRRPEKITASQIQKAFFGVSNILGKTSGKDSAYIDSIYTERSFIQNQQGLNNFTVALQKLGIDSIKTVGIASYGNSISGPYAVAISENLRRSFYYSQANFPAMMNNSLQIGTSKISKNFADSSNLSSAGMFQYLPSGSHIELNTGNNDSLNINTGQQSGFDTLRVMLASTVSDWTASITIRNLDNDTLIETKTISSNGALSGLTVGFKLNTSIKYRVVIKPTVGIVIHLFTVFNYYNGLQFVQFGRGGSSLTMNNSSSETIFSYLLQQFNVKLIVLSCKEEDISSSLPVTVSRFNTYSGISKLIVGPMPDNINTIGLQLDHLRRYRAAAKSNGYAYYDGYAYYGGYSGMVALGINGDGTHPPQLAYNIHINELSSILGWPNLSRLNRSNINNANMTGSNGVTTNNISLVTNGSSSSLNDRIKLFATSAGSSKPFMHSILNIGYLYIGGESTISVQPYGTSGGIQVTDYVSAERFRQSTTQNNFFNGQVLLNRGLSVNTDKGNYISNFAGQTNDYLLRVLPAGNQVVIGASSSTEQSILTVNGGITSIGNTSAPAIKINSSTPLLTPINGAMEYDGNRLFFTPNATNRGKIPVIRSVTNTGAAISVTPHFKYWSQTSGSSTWTMFTASSTDADVELVLINQTAASSITVNSNAGGSDFWTEGVLSNSITINAGQVVKLFCDGTKFIVIP